MSSEQKEDKPQDKPQQEETKSQDKQQQDGVDVSQLSEKDQEFYKKYGRVPPSGAARTKQRENRKQFDSADYFMAAAQANKGGPGGAGGASQAKPKSLPPHMRKKGGLA